MKERQEEILAYLRSYVSEHKQMLMQKVLDFRTYHVVLALEDIFNPQNASAALRTAECFGIQEVHVIENHYDFELNPQVVVGASKWLDVKYHNKAKNNSLACIEQLRSKGYKIVATGSQITQAKSPMDLDLDQKVALFFGTEKEGLSETVLEEADAHLKVPMYGFTESYNISVACALSLQPLIYRLHQLPKEQWGLREDEKNHLLYQWYKKVIKRADLIEQDFIMQRQKKP